MPANWGNSTVATMLEKGSFHFNPKERQCQRMLKLLHNCTISHTSKVMLKILQARLQQYMNRKLPDVQAGFRKGRRTRDQIANNCWIMKKASGGDRIPVELFQILKDDAVKVLHSICQQIWKTQQWQQDWKRSVFIPIPKKGNAKECSNYRTIALISHASKVCSKFSKPGFSST